MILRFPRSYLAKAGAVRRKGFVAAVEQRMKIDGDHVEVESEVWHELTRQFVSSAPASVAAEAPEPTLAELAGNFAGAMGRWVAAGAPVVPEAVYRQRAAGCEACEHWDGSARLGLGKCGAPGCGCTKLKRWLATERCPLNKWPL